MAEVPNIFVFLHCPNPFLEAQRWWHWAGVGLGMVPKVDLELSQEVSIRQSDVDPLAKNQNQLGTKCVGAKATLASAGQR